MPNDTQERHTYLVIYVEVPDDFLAMGAIEANTCRCVKLPMTGQCLTKGDDFDVLFTGTKLLVNQTPSL